jgi:hypothetical protein
MMDRRILLTALTLIGIAIAYYLVITSQIQAVFSNLTSTDTLNEVITTPINVTDGIEPINKKFDTSTVQFPEKWLTREIPEKQLKSFMDKGEAIYESEVPKVCAALNTCATTNGTCDSFENLGINMANQVPGSRYMLGQTKNKLYFRSCYYHQTIDHTHISSCFYDLVTKRFYDSEKLMPNGSTPDYNIQELTGEKTCPDPNDFGTFQEK